MPGDALFGQAAGGGVPLAEPKANDKNAANPAEPTQTEGQLHKDGGKTLIEGENPGGEGQSADSAPQGGEVNVNVDNGGNQNSDRPSTDGDQGGASESPQPEPAENRDVPANEEPGAQSTDESDSGGRIGQRGPTTTESGETE